MGCFPCDERHSMQQKNVTENLNVAPGKHGNESATLESRNLDNKQYHACTNKEELHEKGNDGSSLHREDALPRLGRSRNKASKLEAQYLVPAGEMGKGREAVKKTHERSQ